MAKNIKWQHQMLMRMQRQWITYILLVWMWNVLVTLENVGSSLKSRHETTVWPSNCSPKALIPERWKVKCSLKNLHTSVYTSCTHNSPKLEATQASSCGLLKSLVHPCHYLVQHYSGMKRNKLFFTEQPRWISRGLHWEKVHPRSLYTIWFI